MTSFIIIASIILIVTIFVILFRIQGLVTVARGTHKKVGSSNQINGFLFLLIPILGLVAAIWYSNQVEYFLGEAASEHGVWIDNLMWVTLIVISLMFIITNAALFWFAYKYQYKEGKKAFYYPHNDALEIAWTITPAVILTVLVFWGWRVWHNVMEVEPPKDALQVEIMGKQFAWQVRYPGKDKKLGRYDFRLTNDALGNEFGIDFEDKASYDDFLPDTLHLPVGKPVTLNIRARDVLHSVFLPHFRLKMDAVPGMPTKFTFTPTKTTSQMRTETGKGDFNYELACTEVCGTGHFNMRFVVIIEEEANYKKWFASQTPFLEKEENKDLKGKGMQWWIKEQKKKVAKKNGKGNEKLSSL